MAVFDETAPIEVRTYDSHKRRVRPLSVTWQGEELLVVDIEDSFIATGLDPSEPVCHGWVVRCQDGARFRLVWNEQRGWTGRLLPGPRDLAGSFV
ncbi:MAG: hypothetical protein MUC50_07550 [Myxococcota bacterium]|jgi:hypothetical protein|nr:hypothetical protein [Myxococcota bacterium]